MAKFLIVGLATDGPDYEVLLPTSERELHSMLGGLYNKRYTISAAATGLTLDYEPFSLPSTVLNQTKRDYLYAPSASGNTFLFGSLGGSGGVVDVSYIPYLGQNDLLFAARSWFKSNNSFPYVVRIGGTQASLQVGDWKFSAKYSGQKWSPPINLELTIILRGISQRMWREIFN
jgi:hypothetical protein